MLMIKKRIKAGKSAALQATDFPALKNILTYSK